ncbi:MAG: amino acid permease [Actinomycetota bacterium]|nr:amino acid permease [Actinomycetota bacterium]
MSVMRTKSVQQSIKDTDEPEHRLKKSLSAFDLTVFGIGVCIGAGIFILTGQVAASNSGPAIAISFLLAGAACALAALCYAELASTVPVAGSAYTFSYATLGELVAWTIGWDLILEFTIGAAALSVGFSGYLATLLDGTFLAIPTNLQAAEADGIINLPALLIALLITAVLIAGIKFSSVFNQVIVVVKLAVIAIVVGVGVTYIKGGNYTPFIPPSQPSSDSGGWQKAPMIETLLGLEPAVFGFAGVVTGAAVVFFAFIGFDVVATTAEECKRPQRDLPIGIIASLAIVTVLYMAVSLVITGMQNYTKINPNSEAPLADAFDAVGIGWMANTISVGACIGLIAVAMILMLGQARVAFAMARDGLLPGWLAKVHPRFGTPYRITAIVGVAVAALAGFLPLGTLTDLVNIGTLFAFILVSIGVVVLRRTEPDLPRPFRVPAAPLVATLAVLACLYLMLNLPGETWLRFGIWMAIGFVVYAVYGRRKSRLIGQLERQREGVS